MKRLDGGARAALAQNRHFNIHGFHFLCNCFFRLCIISRMTIADNGLVVKLVDFAPDFVAAVTFNGLDKLVGDTHNNAGVVGGVTCVIKVVLKKDLVTDFRGFVKASCSFIILECKATASA